jgi:RNA polymerase sigma factor (sigma-70 family)
MAYKDDSYYIQRVQTGGDRHAFAALVNKHQTMVYNIALRVTRNREDAEEVAQDAFIKLFNSLGDFRGDSKFTTWMYRITLNLALTKIRKKNLFDSSTDDDSFNEPWTEEELPVEARERITVLREAISALDATDGLLITLFYMDDQPVEEIASITGLTATNVKVRLFRARKKLHVYLTDHLQQEIASIL